MQLNHRSYTDGSTFRPKPVVVEKPELGLIIVATAWGPIESATRTIEIILEQFELLSREDMTTPFESIPSISSAANRLRTGVLMANAYLQKSENNKQWKTAVEVSVVHVSRGVLSWVHVGSPHLLLNVGNNIHPLAYEMDWSLQSKNKGPLFSVALGLDNNPPLNVGSIRLTGEAQLLMLARSQVPRSLFGLEKFEADEVLQTLVQDQSSSPFWLGVAEIEATEIFAQQEGEEPVFEEEAPTDAQSNFDEDVA